MKFSKLVGLAIVTGALVLGGCSTTGDKDGDGGSSSSAPAPVTGGGSGSGSGTTGDGVTTSGAQRPGGVQIDPLEDPTSVLAQRVIYFDFDSSSIRSEYRDVVAAHAEYLAQNPGTRVVLEGHCDERGTREYNIGLGERRSSSVGNLMAAHGAGQRQIELVSFGEERPVDPGHDDGAWSKNRRVEIVYQR
ncbi:MAG: peptidoglycan-associated lipoprotein Pal [Chromatiales bacterium]|nr:peptidoglycan-associated lipoprotein Pal [Chromatiales bacterium]